LCPWGNVHPFVHPQEWTLSTVYIEEWRGKQRISPQGDNFTPTGQNLPLGDNFAPGVKVCPLGAKIRMGLWFSTVWKKVYKLFGLQKRLSDNNVTWSLPAPLITENTTGTNPTMPKIISDIFYLCSY
jgi:hypothetical protein